MNKKKTTATGAVKMETAVTRAAGPRGPAKGEGGRPPLPEGQRKRRVVLYVSSDMADTIEQAGGSVFVERVLAQEFEGM